MTVAAQIAAEKLFDGIRAPIGYVNTLVGRVGRTHYLKVLVDPGYYSRLENVPATFMGYKVVVEKRSSFAAR